MAPKSNVMALALLFAFTFALMGPTLAVEKTGPGVRAPVSQLKALTKQECEGLAGKVFRNTKCAGTGTECVTTDKYHVVHHACINEVAK